MGNPLCDREQAHLASATRAKEELLAITDVEKICATFRVLADPTRMKLVLALMKGEMCVYHLAEVAKGTVSGISHQLRVLRENGIVKVERLGRNMEYSITDDHVREIVNMAIGHLTCTQEK